MKTGLWAMVAAVGVAVGTAGAQTPIPPKKDKDKDKPKSTAPSSGQQPGRPNAPSVPVMERDSPQYWTLTVTVNVRAYTDFDPKTNMPNRKEFDFTSAAVVFPMITDTASSTTNPVGLGGTLSVNDRVIDEKPVFLAADYPAGTRLGKWTLKDWKGEEVQLQVTIPATCYKTEFNEEAAQKLAWPETWPALAESCFKPQLFIDMMPGQDGTAAAVDMQGVKDLVSRWCNGKDPKSIPPATLAKFLCGEVVKFVQVSGGGLNSASTAEIEGFNLQGAAETARSGRGNEYDMVCLLAAVYRAAGLPCRTVIGFDVGEEKRDRQVFNKNNGTRGPRAWVEVALADPNAPGGVWWVPVDPVRLRKSSSRPPPLDRPWKYFGTNEELWGVIPIAFQFHPPTTVVAHGSPALWGWLVTPAPPSRVIQTVRFLSKSTPQTAEEQKKRQEQQRNNNR